MIKRDVAAIDEYLRTHYLTKKTKEIAKELGLKENYLRQRASRLGLRKNATVRFSRDEKKLPNKIVIRNGASTIYKFN